MGASHNNTHLQQTWKWERRGGVGGAALDKWQMGWAIGKLDFYALPGGCKQTNQLWIIIAHQSFSQSAPLPPTPLSLSLSVCLSGKCRVSFKFRQQNKAHNRPRQETDSRNRPSFKCRNRSKEEGAERREECPEVMMILCAFAENFSVRFLRTFVWFGSHQWSRAAPSFWPSHHELHPHRLSLPMSSLHWNRYEQFPFRLQISCGNNRSNVPLAPHTFPASLSFSFSLSLFLFQTIVSSPSVASMNSLAGYNTRMQFLLIHWHGTSFSRVESMLHRKFLQLCHVIEQMKLSELQQLLLIVCCLFLSLSLRD